MNNFVKRFAFIAILAALMFTFAACDIFTSYSASDFAGSTFSYTLVFTTELKFLNNTEWRNTYGIIQDSGTYRVSGSKIYFTWERGGKSSIYPEELEIIDKNTLKYPGGIRLKRQ
jgi:hypothetical protein